MAELGGKPITKHGGWSKDRAVVDFRVPQPCGFQGADVVFLFTQRIPLQTHHLNSFDLFSDFT